MTVTLKPGDMVQHRAWLWRARVVSLPEPLTNLSTIEIKRLGRKRREKHALFSLITNPDEFIFDWSVDDDGTIEDRPKSKNKKPRRKRRDFPHRST